MYVDFNKANSDSVEYNIVDDYTSTLMGKCIVATSSGIVSGYFAHLLLAVCNLLHFVFLTSDFVLLHSLRF